MENQAEDALFNAAVQAEARKIALQQLRDPDYLRDALVEVTQELAEAEKKIEHMTPTHEFGEALMQSDEWEDMSHVAKTLAFKGFGRNNIFAFLRECGVLRWNKEPYQQYVDRGYFKVVEMPYDNPKDGRRMVGRKTVVSQRGIDYIRKLIKEA